MTAHALYLEKPLPSAYETEKQILGAVLVDDGVFPEAAVLKPTDFYSNITRDIYLAMHELAASDQKIDILSVFETLKTMRGEGVKMSELSQLALGIPPELKLEPLISRLKDKALKRDIIAKCSEVANAAANEDDLAVELLGSAITNFQDAYADSIEKTKPTVSVAEALDSTYERWEKMLRKEIVTVETGIEAVDSQLTGGGLEKGMFHVIGARPSRGKTSLALDIAAHNARHGKVVVFFTLELSKDVLMERLIAPLAGVERWRITTKYINPKVNERLVSIGEQIKPWPLFVNAKARTVKDMRLALKDVARQTGGQIDLILVDFLTKMRSDRKSKYEAVSDNANGLAEFAVEFNAASVALAQLNRGNEKRVALNDEDEGRVETTDFRDSGEIEELARTIFGLWGNDRSLGVRDVKLSCIKQGEGGLFDVDLPFHTEYMTFGVRRPLDERLSE